MNFDGTCVLEFAKEPLAQDAKLSILQGTYEILVKRLDMTD